MFDAVIVIGADSEHLAPARKPAWFAHAGVRQQLGLDSLNEQTRLCDDLAALILGCRQCVMAWPLRRADEAMLPAAPVAILSALHRLSFGDDLIRIAPALMDPLGVAAPLPMPSPIVDAQLLPQIYTASSYRSLLACPYQFFARYVLRLAELDEVSEAMEKRDFGEYVHDILHRFHSAYPRLDMYDDETLCEVLTRMSQEVFGSAIERNFLEHHWLARWRKHIRDYLEWQRAREAQGWFYHESELWTERIINDRADKQHGEDAVHIRGRIDRVDQNEKGELAVLDYKLRSQSALREQLKNEDDIQLAFYALLRDESIAGVVEAAYVALDDTPVAALAENDIRAHATLEHQRLLQVVKDLHVGAGMPANGHDSVCQYCEMRGLCRKGYWA